MTTLPLTARTDAERSVAIAPAPRPAPRRTHLRRGLVTLDAVVVAAAWIPVVATGGGEAPVLTALACVIVGLAALHGQHLYRAHVCAVRSLEVGRVVTAAAIAGAAVLVGSRALAVPIPTSEVVVATALMAVLVAGGRSAFAYWLRMRRVSGAYSRPVVLVGVGAEARTLAELLAHHPEAGLRAVGVVGDRDPGFDGVPWLGPVADTPRFLEQVGADGVLIAAADIGADEVNDVTRTLTRAGVHVHLSSGLHGIARQRLRSVPVAREPLFYVEAAGLRPTQLFAKRVIDLTGAILLLTVTAPLLAVAAIAIKCSDGGPVLFRQTRIGMRGRPFTLFKLRTMVPDAEARLVDVTRANERVGGPLFKLAHDPRRTRVGRILERTSFDEVPQLLNVLRNEMSLVGPRPALPHEVEQFEPTFLDRHSVPPGITGLWQVEGRENPAFDVYRRLDLFYVENWSVGLDLAIIATTIRAVLARVLPHSKKHKPA